MPVKTYKKVTNGMRGRISLVYDELTKHKSRPERRLVRRLRENAGRNNQGTLTVRHRGGGYRHKYRMVDFKQLDKTGVPAKVIELEYDPSRTCFIMLVSYADGEKRYHIAPHGLKVGDSIVTKAKAKVVPGNRAKLRYIPVGFGIHNIETRIGGGGQIVRSAGTEARLISVEGEYAQVELPSKELRMIHKECYATIVRVSNLDHGLVKLGNAGRSRHMGRRPFVRGKVMNPCDHPHGGGEGKNPIGLKHPKTKWGAPALGVKTRTRRKWTNRFIIRTRKGKQLIKLD